MRRGQVALAGGAAVIANDAGMADGALERMRGLIGRPPLTRGEALWLEPCSSVHTFGMRSELDLAFLSSTKRIVKLAARVKPFRVSWALGARATLELWPGAIEEMKLEVGDTLMWEEAP